MKLSDNCQTFSLLQLLQILSVLTIDTITWLYLLALVVLAGVIEYRLIFTIFPETNVQFLLAIFPLYYLLWLFIFLSLSALGITLMFLLGKKPRMVEIDVFKEIPLLIRVSRITISYRLFLLISVLPGITYFLQASLPFQWLQKLTMRAYSPGVHIGQLSLLVLCLQDADLTYIGDNVLIGSGCDIVAHAFNTSGTKLKYVSEPIIIGNNTTIGGNTRIGMGVKIEEDAIIEVGSNVLPYTRIGRGEVWGGNPAALIRRRNEYAVEGKSNSEQKQIDLSQLKEIIANAIRLPVEEITESLSSENCMAWDSVAKMSIAASLYDRFSVRVPAADIFKMDSMESIQKVIAGNTQEKLPDTDQRISTNSQQLEIPENPELLPLYDPEKVTQALARRYGDSTGLREKKIVIAASFSAQPLGSTLELWCRGFGLPFGVEFGEYNQLEETLLSPNSVFMNNLNGLNVVLTRPEDLISDTDTDGMIRAGQLLTAIKNYAVKNSNLIVSNLPPAVSPFFHGKQSDVDKLSHWWVEQLEKIEGIEILDLKGIVAQVGTANAQDASFEAIARTAYSQLVYQSMGIAIARLVRGRILPAKKVLALDCDGILWGGIVGEDGIDGLSLSDDHPGRSFRLFQSMLLELKKRGILLVLASKNEPADVWDVFDNHPEMVLRRSDIAAYRINWQKKSANLQQLAQELNLGLDSFVFVDDSPVECLEVQTNTPQVTVVPMPKEPAHYVQTLSKLWCFDSFSITTEDTVRTQLMAQEQQRRELQQNITSLESYLQSLELVVEIRPASERDLPRVAQLTQKTNQFNLSLIRRSLSEIQVLQQESSILVLSVQDRFGDYGLVGVAIYQPENESLLLDTFLMSCRALGRGVEESFLHTIFEIAQQLGLRTIRAPYQSGPRNEQVKTFLLNMGFSQPQPDLLEADTANSPQLPKHIKMLVH